MSDPRLVAVANPGSSTLKLSVVADDEAVRNVEIDSWSGEVDDASEDAIQQIEADGIGAWGVRVVHGGPDFVDATLVDEAVVESLARLSSLAPIHQPRAVGVVEHLLGRDADLPVVACFDTQFHATIADAATTYALPSEWRRTFGLRRFGFHGLSHSWAAQRARALLGPDRPARRIVVAHLGAGASLCAVADGRSVDTTMGFTPLEGLVMATRSGSVDPGLLLWLLQNTHLDAGALADGLEYESGLRGLAGDADMRHVLERRDAGDEIAAAAIDVYEHRLRREIGAMVATLDGLDALVFTGGIGERSAVIRSETVSRLGHLGLAVDPVSNEGVDSDCDISATGATARTLVVAAREDVEIARLVRARLG